MKSFLFLQVVQAIAEIMVIGVTGGCNSRGCDNCGCHAGGGANGCHFFMGVKMVLAITMVVNAVAVRAVLVVVVAVVEGGGPFFPLAGTSSFCR